jgi:hypothetical protein
MFEHEKPQHLTESNRLHHSNLTQTTTSIPTTIISHLDGWKTTTPTKTQAKLNIIKMEDLYDTHDCRAKQIYPDMNPNPKGIK